MYVMASDVRTILSKHLAERGEQKKLSMMSGVSERSIYRIMHGDSRVTRVEVAERLLDSVGHALWEVRETSYREHFPNHNVRKTHCKKGHEYTPENTYWRNERKRDCRECLSARYKAWKKRRDAHS